MKLFIIIPAYNEADSIVKVINSIPRSINMIAEIKTVVVDDGSIDGTSEAVRSQTNALVISHSQNRGVGAAFHTGVDYAMRNKVDILVNIDADGQFNPLDISRLISPILDGQADFVSASRFIDKNYIPEMPWIKLWGNRQVSCLISFLTGRKFYDVSCGFRAYNREALLNLNLFGKFTYTQETFLDLSFKNLRIREMPVKVDYFLNRKSKVCRSIFSYARSALNIILRTVRDYRPLRFFGIIGTFLLLIGLGFDSFVFNYYIHTGNFSPYKAIGLLGILLNIIGLAVLFLGLLADMLYRIRMNQEKMLYYEKKRYYYGKSGK